MAAGTLGWMVDSKETACGALLPFPVWGRRGACHTHRLSFPSRQLVPEHVVMTKEEVTELLAR